MIFVKHWMRCPLPKELSTLDRSSTDVLAVVFKPKELYRVELCVTSSLQWYNTHTFEVNCSRIWTVFLPAVL